MRVQFFNSQLEDFIAHLEKPTIAKTVRMISFLERFGHQLGMPHSKCIGDRLFELRIRGDQEIRIFYTFYNNSAMLLYAYVKKSQSIPSKVLATVRQRLEALDTI